MGMRTTLGSYSLYTARPYANASVVSMLTKNGIIVIGKTNLSVHTREQFLSSIFIIRMYEQNLNPRNVSPVLHGVVIANGFCYINFKNLKYLYLMRTVLIATHNYRSSEQQSMTILEPFFSDTYKYSRCNGARAGFSSVGGQTQSVYISGGVMLEDCPFGNTVS